VVFSSHPEGLGVLDRIARARGEGVGAKQCVVFHTGRPARSWDLATEIELLVVHFPDLRFGREESGHELELAVSGALPSAIVHRVVGRPHVGVRVAKEAVREAAHFGPLIVDEFIVEESKRNVVFPC